MTQFIAIARAIPEFLCECLTCSGPESLIIAGPISTPEQKDLTIDRRANTE